MNLTLAIPSFNNPTQLLGALVSLVRNTDFHGRLIVVNNGASQLADGTDYYTFIQSHIPYEIDWIEPGRNLGWMGGINEALRHADTDYFCMCNDDVLFPAQREFWKTTLAYFDMGEFVEVVSNKYETLSRPTKVGGVGPCSNYVAGYQNLSAHGMPDRFLSPLLIGFCATYRRSLLADGLDESLPGGDDFDLSIRIQNQGHRLLVDRTLYVHHIGGQTGRRIQHKDFTWDSLEHQTATLNAIIKKHGVRKWYICLNSSIAELGGSWSLQAGVSADGFYQGAISEPSDVSDHLHLLEELASACETVTEFGTDDATTAAVFLHAKPKRLTCVDIKKHPNVDVLAAGANGTQFQFIHGSTLDIDIEPTDMLYIDDLHTGEQVRAELARHAGKVKRYLAFHDTVTCGYAGEGGHEGIMPPILEFLREHGDWRILHARHFNNGLMVLARMGA